MFVSDRKLICEGVRVRRGNAGWLCLIAALSVVAAGCAVGESALPLLPPAPVFSSGTFTVANNFAPCPAGSTPANPGAQQCAIAGATGTIDVLTDAFVGSSYTTTVTTRGGTIPVTSCQIQGTVPAGVTLSASPAGTTCVISGTIASPLTSVTIPPGGFVALQLTVRATDSGNPASVDTQDVVIRIFAGFTFITTVLENGTQNRAYTKTVVSNLGGGIGSPPMTACTTTPPLPTGLAIAPVGSNCRITGTPTVSGTFSVTVNGTDSAANTRSSPVYSLVINAPLVVTPPVFTNGTVGRPYTITVGSTAATTGGQRPLTVCSATGLPPGLTIARNAANTACEISGTPTTAGPFNVVVSATDSATTDPAQGGATVTASGTSAAAAAAITINPVLAVPAFVIGNGTQGRPFTLSVPSTGGQQPLTVCSATGLAAGMTIGVDPGNTSNCLIGGTPTANGAFTVVVTATDTATANTVAGSASSVNTPLQVNPVLAIPVFTLQAGAETVAYANTIPTTGGERPLASCNAVGLPTGLNIALDPANTALNVNNCIVSGTPAAGSAGPYIVVVTVTDTASTTTAAGNASSANTPLTINGPLTIPPFVLGNGTEGRAFSQDIPVTGGIQPITNCTISAGALPGGLAIAVSPVPGNCRISGSPAAGTGTPGTFNITVQATDTGAPPGTPAATATSAATPLLINPPLVITSLDANVLDAIAGRVGYNFTFTNSGGQTTFSWAGSSLAGAGCGGMSVSAAGVLNGTPSGAGLCNVTASVTDTATTSTASGTTNGAFTLTVRPELAFAAVAVADGVEGRNYGLAADTCPGPAPCAQTFPTNVLAVAGATDKGSAENGNGPLVACSVLAVTPLGAGTLNAGSFTAIPDPGNLNRCRLQSAAPFPVGAADTYRITVGAIDNPIAAVGVPASSPSPVVANINFLLTVRTALAWSDNILGAVAAGNFPDAVLNRSYGTAPAGCNPGPICISPQFTAAGGIPPYVITPGAVPAGVNTTTAATTLTFSSANVTGVTTTGTHNVVDTGNTAVPVGAGVSADRTINVNANIVTTPNAVGATPPDGVTGRPYGGAGFTPLLYTATGGLGGYVFDPVNSVLIPTPPLGVPAAVACTPAAAVMTCTSGAATISAAPGAYTFNVNVRDTGNQTTPFQQAGTVTPTVTVRAPLTLTPSGVAGLPVFPDAVEGRAWGQGLGCTGPGTACAPAIYTASGGLGSSTAYVFATSSPFPGGIACALSTSVVTNDTATCSAAAIATGGPFPGAFSPTVTLDDGPNATTPSGSGSGTTPAPIASPLTVQAPFTVTMNATQAGGPQPFTANGATTNPDGVEGRPYGQSATDPTRVPLLFVKSGGLGPNYPGSVAGATFLTPAGYLCFNSPPANPHVICHTAGSPTPGLAAPLAAGTAAGSPYLYQILFPDNANASTPTTQMQVDSTLTIRVAISQVTAPSSPLPDARQNSAYGTGAGCSGGACVPLTFTANPATGLGTFTFTSGGFPTGIVCAPVANVVTCSAASVTGAPGPYLPAITINDVANATTTDHTTANGGVPFSVNENLTVIAPLNIPAIASNSFDGTAGRIFNQQFPFTGGIAPFTCSATGLTPNLTANFGGVDCQVTGTPLAADVGGPFALNVTVNDSNNVTTPTGSASTGAMAYTINDVLTITTVTLPGGSTGQAYPAVAGAATLVTTGGETPYSYFISTGDFNAPVGNIQTGVAGTECQGLTFNIVTGVFGGAPTGPAGICGTGGAATFTVDVTDTSTTSTVNGLASQNLSITIAAPVSLAPWAGGAEDAATEGRAVGGGLGGLIDYPISNGIGPFTCAISAGAPGGTGFSAAFTAAPAPACRLSGTPTAADTAASPLTLTIQVTDTGTGATDTEVTAAFDVFGPLTLNSSTGTAGTAYPAAVQNRNYSVAPIPASGGNQNGILTFTNPGAALGAGNCAGFAITGGTDLTATPATAAGPVTCTFDLAINDAATQMSATATLTQAASTIQVNAPLSITPAPGALVNGVAGLVYNSGTPVTFTASGGLGGYTFVDPGDAPTAVCTPLGNFPAGLTFPPTTTATTADLGGTPTTPNTVGTPVYSFEICVQDTANTATVQGSFTSAGNFDIRIMEPLAFAAGPGNNSLQVFRTAPVPATGAVIAPLAPIALAGTGPHTAAVTPNGREVWVTMEGSDTIERFDTITFAALASIDLTAGTFAGANDCNGPRGIVHGFAGTSNNRTYVACGGNGNITVIDTAALTRVTDANTSGGTVTDLAITPDGARVYATLDTIADIDLLDTATNLLTTLAGVTSNNTNGGIAISPDGSRFFVGNEAGAGADQIVMVTIPGHVPTSLALVAGDTPRAIAFDPTGARVYITLDGPNELDVRDGTTGVRVAGGPFNVHSAVITTASRTAGDIVTLTFANEHGFSVGQTLTIAGVTGGGFNGGPFGAITGVTLTTVTYDQGAGGVGAGTGGTAVAGGTNPFGVTIPPSDGVARVFTILTGLGQFVAHDESATPTRTSPNTAGLIGVNPAALAGGPTRLTHIPRPR